MARKKPANLIYDVDESPGFGTLVLLGLQHIRSLRRHSVSAENSSQKSGYPRYEPPIC